MIEIKNLNKYFHSKLVLDNINLKIDKGDKIAIIGSSGSGKSTLLRCINNLEKQDAGQILVNNVPNISPEILSKIGMVFQHFNLFVNMTVLENILYAPKIRGIDASKKARELLEKVNLIDKLHIYPKQLSGGQKQRVAIVRTMILEPEIVLLDEPSSALDPENSAEILALIANLTNEKVTMLIVSHEMGFIKRICNKVIFMDQGKIVEFALTKDFFSSPKSKRGKEFLEKIYNFQA